jgi:hypothetical protein
VLSIAEQIQKNFSHHSTCVDICMACAKAAGVQLRVLCPKMGKCVEDSVTFTADCPDALLPG